MTKKIVEHPNTRLTKEIDEQKRKIDALTVDVLVLRDLLLRTVRILAKYEQMGGFNQPSPLEPPKE